MVVGNFVQIGELAHLLVCDWLIVYPAQITIASQVRFQSAVVLLLVAGVLSTPSILSSKSPPPPHCNMFSVYIQTLSTESQKAINTLQRC